MNLQLRGRETRAEVQRQAAMAVVNGTHDGQAIGDLRLLGHVLTEQNSGQVGLNRLQRSAIFAGCVRFGIVGLELRRTAGQSGDFSYKEFTASEL